MGFLAADDDYILGSVDEHLAILETDQSTLNTVTIYLTVNTGHSMTFDWGDGNTDAVVCDGTLKTVTHDYASTGTYSIRLAGDIDQVTDFRAYNQAWIQGSILGFASLDSLETLYLYSTSVSGAISIIDGLTGLTALNLASTSVTGSLADITALASLTELNLSSTAITGALSNVSGMTSLDELQLQSSSVSGDIADLAALTVATSIDLSGSSVDTYTQGALPAWAGLDIDISDLGLDSVEVDDFLIDLDDGDGAGGSVTIDGTNAAHSTASDAAITALEANSWTITRNDPILTSNQTGGLNTTAIDLMSGSGKSVTIHWGDGNTTVAAGDWSPHEYTHDYSSTEKYGIHLTGDLGDVKYFYADSQSWVEGDCASLSALSTLVRLYLYDTSSTGDTSELTSLTSLQRLRVDGATGFTGDIADFAPLTALTYLNVSGSGITDYTQGALPAWAGCDIDISDLGLTSVEVDDFLIDLEDGGGNGDNGTLNIGGSNAARTSASDTAKANLLTDGWTITVNE